MLYQAYQAHADIMRPVRWFAGFAAMSVAPALGIATNALSKS